MLKNATKLLVCLLLVSAFSIVSATEMKIARDKTALREGPANYYEPILYLSKDTVVSFVAKSEDDAGWLEVNYNGKQGFISEIALKEVKQSTKSNDPFASLDFDSNFGGASSKKNSNDLSATAYTAAIKGFALDYSLRIGSQNIDLDALLDLLKFKHKDYRQVMKETKLAYFPKKGELIGEEYADIGAIYDDLGLAASMSVLQYGVVFDKEMTKKLNIIANILVRQTCDYDKQYKVFIIRDTEPVAYSGPGGYIFISDVLLNAITDYRELVAILAHEVGHVALRHGLKDMAIDSSRKVMDDAFGEIDQMLSDEEKMLSDDLQSEIDSIVDCIKIVRDDKEEFEADEVAVELLRRYKIKKKYLEDALQKLKSITGNKYPEYKVQFDRRIDNIQ